MSHEQEIKQSLERWDKEGEDIPSFSDADMEFFNEERDESPSGWKRMDGIFSDEEIEGFKEPGREYLRRYAAEDEEGRELYTVFWRENDTKDKEREAAVKEKLKAVDEDWKNARPAADDEPVPEDLEEELRQLDASAVPC